MRKLRFKNDDNEIKELINKNIATSLKTQSSFGELLKLNGCPSFKLGSIGYNIRKELLKEAKNGDLSAEDVMPRSYELIGEFLGISNVKTFEDLAIENSNSKIAPSKEMIKKLNKQKEIEEKFGINLTNKEWFQCSIEEVKYSTFSNQPKRNIDYAYVIVNEDNFEILKESMWIKSNMGARKIFYENIASIDFDARGKFHLSSGLIINTKSAEHIQLKHVGEKNYNLLNDAFEKYIKKPKETSVISQSGKADDLVKYAELFEKGLISEEEFNKLKNEIINGGSVQDLDDENVEYNGFCPNCGCEVELDAKFCSTCGNKLE